MQPPSDLRARVLALHAAGKPDREIAATLGISKNAVIGQRHRAGLYANPDPTSPISMASIGRATGPEPRTLMQYLDELKARFDAVLAACKPAQSHRKPATPSSS